MQLYCISHRQTGSCSGSQSSNGFRVQKQAKGAGLHIKVSFFLPRLYLSKAQPMVLPPPLDRYMAAWLARCAVHVCLFVCLFVSRTPIVLWWTSPYQGWNLRYPKAGRRGPLRAQDTDAQCMPPAVLAAQAEAHQGSLRCYATRYPRKTKCGAAGTCHYLLCRSLY